MLCYLSMKEYDCEAALKAMKINVDEIICLIRQLFDRFHVSLCLLFNQLFRNYALLVGLNSRVYLKCRGLRTSRRSKSRRTYNPALLPNIQSYPWLKDNIEIKILQIKAFIVLQTIMKYSQPEK